MPQQYRPTSFEKMSSLPMKESSRMEHIFKIKVENTALFTADKKLPLGQSFKDRARTIIFCGNVGSKSKLCQAISCYNKLVVWQLEQKFWVREVDFIF